MTDANARFMKFAETERFYHLKKFLEDYYSDLSKLSFLEIGAGQGTNLTFFNELGIEWRNIYANELLPERLSVLKENFPQITVFEGPAQNITTNHQFDIIFQSTVFTSVMEDAVRKEIATKMWDLLKPGGIIIWYDFMFNNPKNKQVRKVELREIHNLFPKASWLLNKNVTLAPPIGRRIGGSYNLINRLFPFLRTHKLCIFKKPIV